MKRIADKHTLALYEDGICHPRWRGFEAVALRKLDRVMNTRAWTTSASLPATDSKL